MRSYAHRPMFWIVMIVLLGFAGTATAQSSLSVGYQALHLPDNWINAGFNVDIAARATDTLMIVGEFGLAHQGSSGSDPVRSNTWQFGAGPRWSWSGPAATPFVQVLAGAEVTSAEIPTSGGGTFEDSDAAFMVQAGGGVYVPVGDNWGVVGQADYRPVFFSEETDHQFRIVLGARFLFR